jgi:hypothetical protein
MRLTGLGLVVEGGAEDLEDVGAGGERTLDGGVDFERGRGFRRATGQTSGR